MNPVEEIDRLPFRDPAYRADPYPFYAALREHAPAWRTPNGLWAVTRFADVERLLTDRSLSVEQMDFGPGGHIHDTALGADPPKHTRLRKALAKWFTPRAVERWNTIVVEAIDERLAALEPQTGRIEVVHDLVFPVLFAVISRILGVPVQDAEALRRASYAIGLALGAAATEKEVEITQRAVDWFLDYNAGLVAWKLANPGDGLIDAFLQFERDGEMTRDETIASIQLIFTVGHQDISYLILNGLRIFIERPELAETWRTNAEARPRILEEMIRYDAPEHFATRLTTGPVEVGEVTIPAGETLLLIFGAANRDPEKFHDPDVFDWTRDPTPTRQLSFSAGLHSCAGQMLARAEATALFNALLGRFASIEHDGPIEFTHDDFVRVIERMPIALR